MKRLMMAFIKLYQRTISPDHGPLKDAFPYGYCKYHPTCSQYGYESYERYGFILGTILTSWRILRCNPWSKGGVDPVPEWRKKAS